MRTKLHAVSEANVYSQWRRRLQSQQNMPKMTQKTTQQNTKAPQRKKTATNSKATRGDKALASRVQPTTTPHNRKRKSKATNTERQEKQQKTRLAETSGVTSQEDTVDEHTDTTTNAGNQADEEQEQADEDFSEFGCMSCLCDRACISSEVGGIDLADLLAAIFLLFLNFPDTENVIWAIYTLPHLQALISYAVQYVSLSVTPPPPPSHWTTTSWLRLHSLYTNHRSIPITC